MEISAWELSRLELACEVSCGPMLDKQPPVPAGLATERLRGPDDANFGQSAVSATTDVHNYTTSAMTGVRDRSRRAPHRELLELCGGQR